MANHASHAALGPNPIKGCRFTVDAVYLASDGTPTDPTAPDSEISKDNGLYTDCTEEVTLASGGRGGGILTLTGDETNCSTVKLWLGGTGIIPLPYTLSPRLLPVLESGTAQGGAAGTITLAAGAASYDLTGCVVRTTGGTGGGGGSGSLNNQARMITAYDVTTKVATVVPNWETNPDATTTYDVLLSDLAVAAKKANLTAVGGNTGGVIGFDRALRSITYGTVGGSPTPTNTTFTASSLVPAANVTDQFRGLILAFDKDTTTLALRGQKTDITGSTSGGAFTFTALTTNPQAGDTFTVE